MRGGMIQDVGVGYGRLTVSHKESRYGVPLRLHMDSPASAGSAFVYFPAVPTVQLQAQYLKTPVPQGSGVFLRSWSAACRAIGLGLGWPLARQSSHSTRPNRVRSVGSGSSPRQFGGYVTLDRPPC
jgi:hypothetical protein